MCMRTEKKVSEDGVEVELPKKKIRKEEDEAGGDTADMDVDKKEGEEKAGDEADAAAAEKKKKQESGARDDVNESQDGTNQKGGCSLM